MNLLNAVIIISFTFNFPLFSSQLCKKRPNESSDAESAEQRKRLRQDALHYCDSSFEKGLRERYSASQLRLLEQLKKLCEKPGWPERKKLILHALNQGIHPDDIFLDLNGFPDSEWPGGGQNRPLPIAVTMNDLAFAQKLLKRDSDPNQCSSHSTHSLMFDVSSAEMAQLLLAYKGDATCIGCYGNTLLHAAAWRPRLAPALILLYFNAGADACTVTWHDNNSTLLDNLHNPDMHALSLLVKLGSPLDTQSHNSWTLNKNYRDIIEGWMHRAETGEDGFGKKENIPKYRAMLHAVETAKQEVEQARKEYNGRVGAILKQEIGIDRDSSSLIVAYAQEHVLPQSVQQELAENAARYPCQIDKLPNYDQPERPSLFWRLLGY